MVQDKLQELIRSYCSDDDAPAFRRFYRHESQRLWRYLVARGATEAQAYDLVSESFIRFIKTICKNPIAPSAYLFRIAQNLLIDLQRSGLSREVSIEINELESKQDVGGTFIETRDVFVAINKLTRDEQNIVLLRYWLGMTYKELAEIIGRPEGTLRRQGASALRRLKEFLPEYE